MDDSISMVGKLFNSSNSRKGTAIHEGIIALILLVTHTITTYSEPSSLTNDFINFSNAFTYYAIISLFAAAYIIVSRPFITPEIKYSTCNFCGKPMRTTKLHCEHCNSSSDAGKS